MIEKTIYIIVFTLITFLSPVYTENLFNKFNFPVANLLITTFNNHVISTENDFLKYQNELSQKNNQHIFQSDSINKIDTVRNYVLEEITVSSKKENFLEKVSGTFSYKIHLFEKLSNLTLGNILLSKPGIFIKSYGAEGSLQTISLRGTGAEYTSVILNGITLNGTLSGIFDFSKFSSDDIYEVIVKKGNDFDVKINNSFGGTIELNPFPSIDSNSSFIKYQIGSFGFNSIFVGTNFAKNLSSYFINITRKFSKNDYEYTFEGEKLKRLNSDVTQFTGNGGFADEFQFFKKSVNIKLFFHIAEKQMGLPTFVANNRYFNSQTRNNEKDFLFSSNIRTALSQNIFMNIIGGYQKNSMLIEDPLTSLNLKTKRFSIYENNFTAKIFFAYFSDKLKLEFGSFHQKEAYEKSELEKDNNYIINSNLRLTNGFSSVSNFEQNIFSPQLKLFVAGFYSFNSVKDYGLNRLTRNFSNFRFGIGFRYNNKFPITIFANIGKGKRLPNYYEESFNNLLSLKGEKLVPEEITNAELGVKFQTKKVFCELVYFNLDIDNKIIWQPQRVAIFSPRNIGKVNSSGIEFKFQNLRLYEFLTFELNYSLINSLKKSKTGESDNSYNKQLVYIPRHKVSSLITLEKNNFSINLNTSYFSRRFFTEDNDIQYSLSPVILFNTFVYYSINFFKINLTTQVSILNVTNEQYQLIQSFPMPGREYRLTIKVEV